jgi:hypothetical protein
MSWHCHGTNYAELVSNLQKRGILTSPEAASAMSKVDRKLFVPPTALPYKDSPQVIGFGATISAPHMHSYCLSLLADYLKPGMSVLDVGSGSGYLTAVLGLMVCLHTSQSKHFFSPPSLLCYHFTRLNHQKKSPWDISCNNHFTRLLSEEMSGHSKHDDLLNLQRQATHAWRWAHGGLNFFLFFSFCGDVT